MLNVKVNGFLKESRSKVVRSRSKMIKTTGQGQSCWGSFLPPSTPFQNMTLFNHLLARVLPALVSFNNLDFNAMSIFFILPGGIKISGFPQAFNENTNRIITVSICDGKSFMIIEEIMTI